MGRQGSRQLGNLVADVGNGGDFPEGRARGRPDREDPAGRAAVPRNQLAVARDLEADPQRIDAGLTGCQEISHQRRGIPFGIAADAAAVDHAACGQPDGLI